MALSLVAVINERIDEMLEEITKNRAKLPDWWVEAAEEKVATLVEQKEERRRMLDED